MAQLDYDTRRDWFLKIVRDALNEIDGLHVDKVYHPLHELTVLPTAFAWIGAERAAPPPEYANGGKSEADFVVHVGFATATDTALEGLMDREGNKWFNEIERRLAVLRAQNKTFDNITTRVTAIRVTQLTPAYSDAKSRGLVEVRGVIEYITIR